MDGGYSLCLTTAGKQELGGLEEVEEKEAASKHEESQDPENDVEVPPAHVVGFGAAWRRADVARFQVSTTGVVWDESPGD